MYTDINKRNLFENVNLGFEFEFFSPTSRKELSEKLTKYLGKKVEWSESYHSRQPVSQNVFKIEPDFSGGFKMNELITGVMPYNEAIHVMFKVFNFIAEHGFTSERTGIHINISLNEDALALKSKLQTLNVFKYILNLDEAKIFEMWPSAKSRTQRIYKNSVLNIYPKTKFIAEKSLLYSGPANPSNFNLPHSKYFGLNFTKLSNNYLEVRYAGGEGYQNKRKESVDLINYMAESIYSVLQTNNEYSVNETRKINDILKVHTDLINSVKTFEGFKRSYPDLELYIDLRDDPRIVEANYANVKEKIFELITTGNLRKGLINYDTSAQRLQLKDSKLKEGFSINNIDFINCSIEGEITNCNLFASKVRSSHIRECKIITGNDIRYCYIKNCQFERDGVNRIDLTYIKSKPEYPIYADLNECIIRSGTLGLNCKVDSKTEFIKAYTPSNNSDKL